MSLAIPIKRWIKKWVPIGLRDGVLRPVQSYRGWRAMKEDVSNWRTCWFYHCYPKITGWVSKSFVAHVQGTSIYLRKEDASVLVHTQSYFSYPITFKPGCVVISIGAHIGSFGLLLAARGARVFAFEPNPENVIYLRKTKEMNSLESLTIFEKAVSDLHGKAVFSFGKTSTLGRLNNSGFMFPRGVRKGEIEVETVTLQDLQREFSWETIKFLKVDCEGGEYGVLMNPGAREFLQHCEFLLIETHPVNTGYDKFQLYHYLVDLGFQIQVKEHPVNGCAEFFCRREALGA